MQTYTVKRSKYLEQWYLNDQIHNEFGTAITYYNDNGGIYSEYYYLNDKPHRTDGPAAIHYNENGGIKAEHYYLNGEYHRAYGPAAIYYNENGSIEAEVYYLHNRKLTKEEFISKIQQQSCDGKIVEIDGKQYKLIAV